MSATTVPAPDATASRPTTPDAPNPTRRETALRVAGLLVGTASVTAIIIALGGWPWVVVVYAVIAIIMLHELGHYVTARMSGMKATEFFVGFGPKLWSVRRGETEYGVKALPLGGYVRILGMTSMEELDASDEPRSFINQSTRKRVLVASAGSIVHVLLALLLAFSALFFIGRPIAGLVRISDLVQVKGVVTPAQLAGLRPGERIVSIDGKRTNWNNVIEQIQSSNGKPLAIVVSRDGRESTVLATPRAFEKNDSSPLLGIQLYDIAQTAHPGFVGSASLAGTVVWEVTTDTFGAFEHAFSFAGISSLFHQVTNAKAGAAANSSPNSAHSIFGFLEISADAAKAGIFPLLEVLISLNISLAILNMIPMLPLDGGHVAIAVYERARTRRGMARYRADVSKLLPFAYAFMAFLLLFVASKAYLDLAHGVTNPFG